MSDGAAMAYWLGVALLALGYLTYEVTAWRQERAERKAREG